MSFLLKLLQPWSTLLIASTQDTASMNLCQTIMKKPYWSPIEHDDTTTCNIFETYNAEGGKVFLWLQNEPLLGLDFPDRKFLTILNREENIHDLIFLSKHVAASGKPSLTVHPIGIPWQLENSRSGGIPGRCSPPSFRIASIYRQLLVTSKEIGLSIPYEVTMEATHHGPYCDKPSCFVEIGSSEIEWNTEEFGHIWSEVLEKNLNVGYRDKNACITKHSEGIAIVMIGGGHYVPKLNDLARLGEGIYIGHALTTYALQEQFDSAHVNFIDGKWQLIIQEAILSTKLTYQDLEVMCVVDKKAFNAEVRKQIETFLREEGISWTYKTADVQAMWKNKHSAAV
jgi:D-aminoacyl-tRNA deacylase